MRPIYGPVIIELADNTTHMINVNYSLSVGNILKKVCSKLGILPHGLLFDHRTRYFKTIFLFAIDGDFLWSLDTLEEQGLRGSSTEAGKVLHLAYRFLPKVNSFDNARSLYLKYLLV